MSTNSDYFKSALQKIGVLAEGETPSAEQGADMLVIFNDMMDNMLGEGIDIGFSPQSSTTDSPDIAEGYKEIIKCLLAVRAADHFECPVPTAVGLVATNGYNRLLRESVYNDARQRRFDHLPFNTNRRSNIINGQ